MRTWFVSVISLGTPRTEVRSIFLPSPPSDRKGVHTDGTGRYREVPTYTPTPTSYWVLLRYWIQVCDMRGQEKGERFTSPD